MTCRLSPTRRAAASLVILCLVAGGARAAAVFVPTESPVTAVPPAESAGPAVPAKRTALVAPAGTPARRVDLAAPADAEVAPLRAYNAAAGGRPQPLAVGFGRETPAAARDIAFASLDWVADAGGGRSARIEIASPGAAALRVALALPGGATGVAFRFQGSAVDAQAFGPYPAGALAAAAARGEPFWSPVLAGDTATIEISADPDVPLDAVVLKVPRVSHLLVDGAGARTLSPAVQKATGIGAAGACERDVACVAPTDPAAALLAKSVARLMYVAEDGRTYLCTGTLLNDSVGSKTPYLLAASHCLGSASVASTLNTFWFYDAVACGSRAAPPYVQLTGGAALLGRSQDNDWSIVRLNETAPAGTSFAAWRAEPIPVGTSVASIHHPEGDLAKFSSGRTTSDYLLDDGYVYGTFNEVVWSQGVTEGGSSGGALVTLSADGRYYEVRGGLYAGISSCSLPREPDYFSHFERALPLMREYLTPNASNPTGTVAAVEFYNRTLDHYFLSTDPTEIAKLDSGRIAGWVRTGLRFLAYDNPQPGTSPVCRFYRAPAYGDSHFYSASPSECAATAAAHPVDWLYESASVFYVRLPDPATGACPAGTIAVYRYFNAVTINHRYTTEVVVRNQMAQAPQQWIAEGYGRGPYYPSMCAAAQ